MLQNATYENSNYGGTLLLQHEYQEMVFLFLASSSADRRIEISPQPLPSSGASIHVELHLPLEQRLAKSLGNKIFKWAESILYPASSIEGTVLVSCVSLAAVCGLRGRISAKFVVRPSKGSARLSREKWQLIEGSPSKPDNCGQSFFNALTDSLFCIQV